MKIKKYFLIIILLLVGCLPSCGSSQEDGWKNLKWGMTLQEIKDNYINENTGKKCNEMSEQPRYTAEEMTEHEKSIDTVTRDVTRVLCDGKDVAISMYKGKFVSKSVDLSKLLPNGDGRRFSTAKMQADALENILKDLKKKYPKGNISYIEQKIFFGLVPAVQYPMFQYDSNKIVVHSSSDPNDAPYLVFFEANFYKTAVDENSRTKKILEEEQQKANGPKNPF